jgi:hypothetical protein
MATVAEIEKRIEQLKNQKQALLAKEKQKERKERTHKLIQIGALVEKYLNVQTVEEADKLLKKIATEISPTEK